MSAYLPHQPWLLAVLAALIAGVLVGGHWLSRASARTGRWVAWPTLVLGTFGVERLLRDEPPGLRMVALISFALLGMKVLVVLEERARGMPPLSFPAWLGFAVAWLGMRPRLFTADARTPRPGGGALIRGGVTRGLLGLALVVLARVAWVRGESLLWATVLLLPGLSLLIHFGLCNVMAGAWRLQGVDAEALFRAPLLSQSLAEFWSRRWNLAFSEMTATAVYRPLSGNLGRGPALVAAFAVSGLLHEMAISVPVRSAYGLPLLYFVLHGGLVLVERRLGRAGRPVQGWVGRAWTLFWVAGPLPILFHRPFLAGVLWPLIGIEGA